MNRYLCYNKQGMLASPGSSLLRVKGYRIAGNSSMVEILVVLADGPYAAKIKTEEVQFMFGARIPLK